MRKAVTLVVQFILTSTVRVKRSTGYMHLDGHPGVGADMENYCRIFDIKPESMLGL